MVCCWMNNGTGGGWAAVGRHGGRWWLCCKLVFGCEKRTKGEVVAGWGGCTCEEKIDESKFWISVCREERREEKGRVGSQAGL